MRLLEKSESLRSTSSNGNSPLTSLPEYYC
jgi:hypothetical protein